MKEEFRIEEELQESAPHSGHRDRFLKKLEALENTPVRSIQQKNMFAGLVSIAAMLALVLCVTTLTNQNQTAEVSLKNLSPKLEMNSHANQLEVIYAEHVSPQLLKIKKDLPELATQIELLEILENEYIKLKELLLTSGGDSAVTQEMIRNHKLRLSIMEQLVTQIQISNHTKNKQYEISI